MAKKVLKSKMPKFSMCDIYSDDVTLPHECRWRHFLTITAMIYANKKIKKLRLETSRRDLFGCEKIFWIGPEMAEIWRFIF